MHQSSKAIMILDQMRKGGLVPDATCYSLAIDACVKTNSWQDALGLLQLMQVSPAYPFGVKKNEKKYESGLSHGHSQWGAFMIRVGARPSSLSASTNGILFLVLSL